jgi:hypothetical protein
LGRRRKKKPQKIRLEHRHHAALFDYFEIGILKFQKVLKIYVDVVNYVHYRHAKF